MILELTQQERETLLDLLAQSLKSLPIEIHRTDSIDYRKSLEEREEHLRNIEQQLRSAALVEN